MLSPSQMCTGFLVCPCGACGAPRSEGHDWRGEWGPVSEQDEQWKTCSWGRESGIQGPGEPTHQHNKGSVYQSMFTEPKSIEDKMARARWVSNIILSNTFPVLVEN